MIGDWFPAQANQDIANHQTRLARRLATLAAAYGWGLVTSHPYRDGNKRTAFLTMVVFTIVFGRLAGLPSESGAPYPVMVFAGMLPWFLFSSILTEASSSIVGNANLIGKVYFPRIIIPASSAVTALVDFGINFVMLAALMAWYAFVPSWRLLLLPGFVILAVLAARAVAIYGFSVFSKQIQTKWKHILFWGGLRGAIALALVLSLPASLSADRELMKLMAFDRKRTAPPIRPLLYVATRF